MLPLHAVSRLRSTRSWLLWAACLVAGPIAATETENHGLRVLPAPPGASIDGEIGDWDLSAGIFACGELEHLRDRCSVWLHAMHDRDRLYVLARWKDETPLNNPVSFGGHGFNADCLQIRCIVSPDTAERTISWWTAWRDNLGTSVIDRGWPGPSNGVKDNPLPNLVNAVDQGVVQAFRVDADGSGYVQELAIPWKQLSVSGHAPEVGERLRLAFEPNFTAGSIGRITIKDLFDESVAKVDRIFTFRAYDHWGWATLEAKGGVEPQPVRCADGRTFPVTMRDGVPVVDWTGLEQRFSWPGFEDIAFEMPFDGVVSLNIVAADGTIARHLLNGERRSRGKHIVQWDGLGDAVYRTRGEPLPSGTYAWKALVHPGINLTLRGWASGGGRAPWAGSPKDFWLGDHGVPSAIVTDGQRMYLACNGAEGGKHLIATDDDGNVQWSLQNTTGSSDPEIIAVDRGVVYVVHNRMEWMKQAGLALLSRVDAATGAYQPWAGRKSHLLSADDIFGVDGPDGIVGIAGIDGRLYISTGQTLAELDGATGALAASWPISGLGALLAIDARTLWAVRGDGIVAIDAKTGAVRTVAAGLGSPTSLGHGGPGRVLVSLAEPANQVLILSDAGKELARVGRPGGRAALGPWQADGLRDPHGVALDPKGRLWVMEHDEHPKRVSVWSLDGAGGALARDWFGPTHYGASGGAISPRDPHVMVGEGCEWRIDPATGQAACLGIFERSLHNFAAFREVAGRLFLVTYAGVYATGTVVVWERLSDGTYAKRASFSPKFDDKKRVQATVLWRDLDGDGREQPAEVQERAGYLCLVGSNGWSINLGNDLALYGYDTLAKRLVRIPAPQVAANGVPTYDLGAAVVLPEAMSQGYDMNYGCAVPSADGRSVLVNLRVPEHPAERLWTCFDAASGAVRWTYPNPYFQVHGSHRAPAPEPGLFRGAFGPVGLGRLPVVGDFWTINGNLGEWWVLNADGFFVDRIFNGNVFDWRWPEEAKPGLDMSQLPAGSGAEDFGGSMTQASDGSVSIQAGKVGLWNLAMGGLERATALSGGPIELSADDVQRARVARSQPLPGTVAGKLVVKRATPTFSGALDADFAGQQVLAYKKSDEAAVRTAFAKDGAMLYVGWDVRDATPWINGAADISQMYASGDTVDLQLGTAASADPGREGVVAGDLRLSIGNFKGSPTAVLYRFVSAEKKVRTFSSGVIQGWQVDWVDVLASAKIAVKVNPGHGYVVEVAVPLADLGLTGDGATIRGDVGVTHGDPAGTRTRLRTYWSNQQTGLVDDVVFELKPTPAAWGTITFE
jgi:hypothetical protein